MFATKSNRNSWSIICALTSPCELQFFPLQMFRQERTLQNTTDTFLPQAVPVLVASQERMLLHLIGLIKKEAKFIYQYKQGEEKKSNLTIDYLFVHITFATWVLHFLCSHGAQIRETEKGGACLGFPFLTLNLKKKPMKYYQYCFRAASNQWSPDSSGLSSHFVQPYIYIYMATKEN